MRNKLFFWIYPPFILAFVVSVFLLTFFSARSITSFFGDLSSFQLRQTVMVTANSLEPLLRSEGAEGIVRNRKKIQERCNSLVRGSRIRITLIDPDGVVLAETGADPEKMDLHNTRAEIQDALSYGTGFATRKSASTGITTMYEAHVLRDDNGAVYGFLRTAIPFGVIDAHRTALILRILSFGAVVVVLVSFFSLFLTRRLTVPIAKIHAIAGSFSDGWFSERIPEEGPEEIASLASVMNRMAVQLDERIKTMKREREKVQAILQGMMESVAVLSSDLSLLLTNRSFDVLFHFDNSAQTGYSSLLQATHSTDLCDFMEAAIRAGGPLETTLTMYGQTTRQIRAATAPLPDGTSVLVISDLTRMHRLETIRRDFTANVSHELKTPITSIKAALETVRDMSCARDSSCGRFLDMAVRGTVRLEAILSDLLSLARIEEEEREGLPLEMVDLDGIVESIRGELAPRMDEANVVFEKTGLSAVEVRAHPGLLRQAIYNLVDNAVKYGASGGVISLSINAEGASVRITVADQGPGIDERDRSRLFERFYRVDKARSRETGGTGLGLAIVKHIALAHGGSVRLDPESRKGAAFTFELPRS